MAHNLPDSPTRALVMGATGMWEVVVGMEVHAQIDSKSKLFSGAATAFPAEQNTQTSLVDAALPGMLPVLNKFCVEQAVKTGLGLNARINLFSVFDRKNYFYPDLPAGYQISQFYYPIVGNGTIEVELGNGEQYTIGIERLHLEQDAGKSLHDLSYYKSYIDLNRSGIALMEIVSAPDMRSAEEAMAYMRKLRTILRYLGTNDGNMEEGSLRADVNISVRRPGEPLGTRVEVKNVNSIRFIGQAVNHEVSRQIQLIEGGGTVSQETRLYDPHTGHTRLMRSKEDSQDYRYFPDPDLSPLHLTPEFVEHIRETLPELPDPKKQRLMREYDLTLYEAGIIVSDRTTADFYESAVAHTTAFRGANPAHRQEAAKLVANWLLGDYFAALSRDNLSMESAPVPAEFLAELVDLILDETISGKIAKTVFVDMWQGRKAPGEIVAEQGLRQVVDPEAIRAIVRGVLDQEMDKVVAYHSGKDKLFGYFVGQVMKAMAGKGNPAMVNDMIHAELNARGPKQGG